MSRKRWLGLRSQRSGASAEDMAAAQLRLMGIEQVEKVHNAWKVIEWVNRSAGLARVVPAEKVSGDYVGILPGSGKRVLAEVKTGDDDRLQWGRLRPHQHEALRLNHACGGVSLLVWVTPEGNIHVMSYPALLSTGWKAGKSVDHTLACLCAWDGVTHQKQWHGTAASTALPY